MHVINKTCIDRFHDSCKTVLVCKKFRKYAYVPYKLRKYEYVP